jgi:large subunit ribosomal protein L18
VAVPVGEEAFPSEERLTGRTIADYASKLSAENKEANEKGFGRLRKEGFRPEEYPAQFEKVKAAITGAKE